MLKLLMEVAGCGSLCRYRSYHQVNAYAFPASLFLSSFTSASKVFVSGKADQKADIGCWIFYVGKTSSV